MDWREQAACRDSVDPEAWFDIYENNVDIRSWADKQCLSCPVQQRCFGTGVSNKEWGVWGGVYLEDGEPSQELNSHKTATDWTELWERLTMEREVDVY